MNNVADLTMTGEAANNQFGRSVSTAGDVNDDGYSDVIVGASGYSSDTGRAYIYYGGASMNNAADVTMTGEAISDNFGVSVSTAGDVNGDGYSDVIVGAHQYSSNTGRAYIYYGGVSMDNASDVTMTGEATNNAFGLSVSTAGDVNGDGYSDVIVGAWASSSTGKAYIYITQTPPVKPTLVSVRDFPKDQGGKVVLNWARSGYDIPGMNTITGYLVQKSLTGSNFWEDVSTVTARNIPYYAYTASAGADSVLLKFRITAQTTNSGVFWCSNIMSGFSVDNLAPAQVKNLAGMMDTSKIYLHWKHNTDADLAKYRIYRNDILIAEKTDTLMNDFSVLADSTYKYRVAAVDIHGNEGAKSDSVQFIFGQMQLNLTVLIQGFYDNVTGLMVKDTVTVLLKNITTPFATIYSAKILS